MSESAASSGILGAGLNRTSANISEHQRTNSSNCCGRLWREITSTKTSKCVFGLYIVALIITIALLVSTPSTALSNTAKSAIGISALAPFILYILYKEGSILCCCRRQISPAEDREVVVVDRGIPTYDELVRANVNLAPIVSQEFSVVVNYSFSSTAGTHKEEASYDNLNADACRVVLKNIRDTHARHEGRERLQYNVQFTFKGPSQEILFTWSQP